MPLPHFRRLAAAAAVAVVALAVSVGPATAASAASADTGWVRVAHLSPDTKRVDVRLVALAGDSKVLELDDVAYGSVSKYWALPQGTYAVAMRPAGSSTDAPPVVQAAVNVRAHTASTVAIFGRNAQLKTKIITDDLASPAAGKARVRLVQASTAGDPVTVTAANGTVIARDATLATVSKYASTPVGTWKLTTKQGDATARSAVVLKAGEVVSLFVLDKADGSTTVRTVVDSSGVGATPKGYLATGGGYLAHQAAAESTTVTIAGFAALAAGLLAAAAVVVRRRRPVGA